MLVIMKKTTRRDFLSRTALTVGAAFGFGGLAAMAKTESDQITETGRMMEAARFMNIPLGFQTWPVKERMAKDFPGTLKTMAGSGYKLTELCSPAGYADIGFGFLKGMSAQEIKKTINDAGLEVPSCHYGFAEFAPDKIDKTIEFAHGLGLSQMICSTFWLPKTATLKDYTDHAEQLNKAAAKIKAAGMQAGFHNHDFEFSTLEGSLIYDALMKAFDASLVKMQFQTEVINLGYKAATYFNKYPGRFISAHLSDWSAEKKEVAIGKGVIDWKEFFAAAKTGGVKNFFVEMDFATFSDSAKYIQAL
jgi:sugar phosphate isomerase/epimerase